MASSKSSLSSDPLIDAVARMLRQPGRDGARVAVGLSGGRDSMVLLDAAWRVGRELFPISLSAIHVNHGLSRNADEWERFCATQCALRGVSLDVVRVQVDSTCGKGIEATAREARYRAYSELNAEFVLLAHHQGDQAETLLHNLLRGAGTLGLAGMPATRASAGSGAPQILRPFLHMPPGSIQGYAERYALPWIRDESNEDIRYTRNFLRHNVLPLLKARFPNVEMTLAATALRCSEDALLMAELAAMDRERVSRNDRIVVERLRLLTSSRVRNLLRLLIRETGEYLPDERALREAARQLIEMHSIDDTEFEFRMARHSMRVFSGELHLLPLTFEPVPQKETWAGQAVIKWGAGEVRFARVVGAGFSAEAVNADKLALAPRQGGERLQLHPKRPRRSLKHLFQEAGIPPWEREQRPILWCGDRVVWVAGLGVDVAFQTRTGEDGWQAEWVARP